MDLKLNKLFPLIAVILITGLFVSPLAEAVQTVILTDGFEGGDDFAKWSMHLYADYQGLPHWGTYGATNTGNDTGIFGLAYTVNTNVQMSAYMKGNCSMEIRGAGSDLLWSITDVNGFWFGLSDIFPLNYNSTVPSSVYTQVVINWDRYTQKVTMVAKNGLQSYTSTSPALGDLGAMTSLRFVMDDGVVDDVSISYNKTLSESPGIDAMYSLIGIVALIGVGLPIMAMTGGSPVEKALRIVIYLIVVGALVAVAFGTFGGVPGLSPP